MAGRSSWEHKLDHRLRALLARVGDGSADPRQPVHVFVRFAGAADKLAARGIQVRSVSGDIATAWILLSDIPRAASALEVLFLELAQPVGPDTDLGAAPSRDLESTSSS